MVAPNVCVAFKTENRLKTNLAKSTYFCNFKYSEICSWNRLRGSFNIEQDFFLQILSIFVWNVKQPIEVYFVFTALNLKYAKLGRE